MTADELARLLDELGRRLGPTGERVFALAVRQVYIDAALWIAFGVAVGIASAWVIRASKHADSYDRGPMKFLGSCGVLAGIGIAAFGLSSLLNAEYAAIRALLGSIG